MSALSFRAALAAEEPTSESYWDYGIGLGAVHYEHYPAAEQFADLALPAPTFQYRGKILRADDRDGAHLYLLKGSQFTLELSGAGFPSLNSANNRAREGMDNLPWLLALGPQLVHRGVQKWEFAIGAYQALSTDFYMTRTQGNLYEAKASYLFGFPFELGDAEWRANGKLSASFVGASSELQNLYYEVPTDKVTPSRAAYEAKAGFLSRDLTYYQSFKTGKFSLNLGLSLANYEESANRESPLHRSGQNLTALVGMNYILGGSARRAIPENETSGVINRIQDTRRLQPME